VEQGPGFKRKWEPTRPIATVRSTDLYAYLCLGLLLITFASVTDCLKNKRFIHEQLFTSNLLNCVNFTITLS